MWTEVKWKAREVNNKYSSKSLTMVNQEIIPFNWLKFAYSSLIISTYACINSVARAPDLRAEIKPERDKGKKRKEKEKEKRRWRWRRRKGARALRDSAFEHICNDVMSNLPVCAGAAGVARASDWLGNSGLALLKRRNSRSRSSAVAPPLLLLHAPLRSSLYRCVRVTRGVSAI